MKFLSGSGASAGGFLGTAMNGLGSFVGGLPGTLLGNYFQKQAEKRQHARNLEIMEKSQQQNLETMSVQNQYSIDAEKRAQEWNNIGAQMDRAAAAGVSSTAALGGSGAGGLMSVSSAPSGGSPSAPSSTMSSPFVMFSQAAESGASIAMKAAQAALLTEQRRGVEFDNMWKEIDSGFAGDYARNKQLALDVEFLQNKLRKTYVSGGKNSPQYRYWMEELNNLMADTATKNSNLDTQQSLRDYYEATAAYYNELGKDNRETRQSRINQALAAAFNWYKQGALAVKQASTEEERAKLVKADTEVAQQRKKEIEKQVERIGKLNGLTDQQIKQIKNKIALSWAKFGVNTAVSVSSEARKWLNPFANDKPAIQNDDRDDDFGFNIPSYYD